jgi:DEAD/DEAH box helicase domain-containing protein
MCESMPTFKKEKTLEDLRLGKISVIIASNALEAGVDIPQLDACLLKGYPGKCHNL